MKEALVFVLMVYVSFLLDSQVLCATTRMCVDGQVRGSNTCSFICGVGGQFHSGPSTDSQRCQSPGEPVPQQCAEACVGGEWVSAPCAPCCTAYPDNHCNITCDRGTYTIEAGCDPVNPPTRPLLQADCVDGQERGSNTCSFICGLNGQFYPLKRPTELYGNERCQFLGEPVGHNCKESCVEGRWRPSLCSPCCTEYPDNHCDIKCRPGGYSIAPGCDPLIPPTPSLATKIPMKCRNGDVQGENACSFICGLEEQWFHRDESGQEVGKRCQRKGEIISPLCNARTCLDGEWLPMPCPPCCQEYPENSCSITCTATGRYVIQDGCDPFHPHLRQSPSPRATCTDGDIRGQMTCGYICGLNNKWYPQSASGQIVSSKRCRRQGHFVPGTCPEICGAGQWHPLPCFRCCQKYSPSTTVGKLLKILCDSRFPPTIEIF